MHVEPCHDATQARPTVAQGEGDIAPDPARVCVPARAQPSPLCGFAAVRERLEPKAAERDEQRRPGCIHAARYRGSPGKSNRSPEMSTRMTFPAFCPKMGRFWFVLPRNRVVLPIKRKGTAGPAPCGAADISSADRHAIPPRSADDRRPSPDLSPFPLRTTTPKVRRGGDGGSREGRQRLIFAQTEILILARWRTHAHKRKPVRDRPGGLSGRTVMVAHHKFLPRIVVTLTVKIKVIIRRR
jgi:hypothetical protein